MGRSAENLGSDLKNIGKIALAGAAGFVAFATKAAFSAARIEELTFALHAIAKANNISQKTVDETVKSLRGMNIAHRKAIETTAMFVQGQLDLADSLKLAKVAQDLAVLGKMDSSEATEKLTAAILSQRAVNLREFKIITTLDQIYEEYAATINKSASELTDLEKRKAFLIKIFKEGEKVAGTYDAAMQSVSKRFRSLTGRIIPDFIDKIGEAFKPTLAVIIDAITNSIKDMSKWVDENGDKIAEWGQKLGEIATKGIEFLGKLFRFLIDHKEIIIGVLVALGLAVGFLVATFISAHAVAIAVFTGIVAAVAIFANVWENVSKGIKFWVEVLKQAWEENFLGIRTAVEAVVNFFTGTVLPAIQEWFNHLKAAVEYHVAIWQFAWAVIKTAVNIVVGWFEGYVLPHIRTFFEGIENALQDLADFFNTTWNWIKNVAVLPVANWFMTYVWPTIKGAFDSMKSAAISLLNKIREVFDQIKEKVESVINFIRDLIDNFKPRISIGIDLPDIEGAWRNLRERARNVGIPGFQTGGVVPGPIGAPVPIMAHAGEVVKPAGVGAPAGGSVNLEVNIGLYAGTETEKRNIARDLYSSLVRVAQSQNKTVRELLGG